MMKIKGWLTTGFLVCLLVGCNQNCTIVQSNKMEDKEKSIMEISNNDHVNIDPYKYSYQLDGYQYILPLRVNSYIKNGWKLNQMGNLEPGKSGVVELEKGENKIEITIQNLSNYRSDYQSCEAKGLSVKGDNTSDDFVFTIFDGIKIGMSQKELESKIAGLYYLVSYADGGGTDYQILDDLYFKEGYGYLISTSNGLIKSININYLADGKNREDRTGEVTNNWFNDPVRYVKPGTIIPIDFNCIYEIDVNRDGIDDKVDFKFLDYNDGTLLTVVNGTVNVIRSDTSVRDAYLISQINGSCAVLLDLDESDNYSPCCIYQLIEPRCKKTMEKKGNIVRNTLTENAVTLESYPYIIGAGWSARTDYKITESFDLIPTSDSRLNDFENRKGIKVKKAISVTLFDKEGKSYKSELKPGEIIKLKETDFQTVLRFTTGNGITGDIQISPGKEQDCCFLYYNGDILTDFFDKDSLIFAG